MSFVWKHPNSDFWTGGYRDEAGKWRRFATKQTHRAKAIVLAQDLEDLGAQIREQRISELAFLKEVDRMRRRRFGDRAVVTVRLFFADWLRTHGATTAAATGARYDFIARRFLAFLAGRADEPLAHLEPGDCRRYFEHLAGLKLAPATRSLELTMLRTILSAARKDGLITRNPAEAVEKPRHIHQVCRKTFTTEEVEILLRQCGEHSEWYTVTLFGCYTAMRLGDAKSRQWSEVDFVGHKLTFRVQKTGEQLELPLHARLEEHLAANAGDALGPITPELNRQAVGGAAGLSQQFIGLMRAAGLSTESVESGGRRRLATRSFHSLRKSFNSWLRAEGVSQEDRKGLTGHKSDAVNDRYTETKLATLRAAVGRLPRLERLPGAQLHLGL